MTLKLFRLSTKTITYDVLSLARHEKHIYFCPLPQALYGANTSAEGPDNDDDSTSQGSGKKTTTQEPPGTEGSDAELCTDTKVNALFNSAAGETFVFKGTVSRRLSSIPLFCTIIK